MNRLNPKNHIIDHCSMCGITVRCGVCNNNCCNGAYGTLSDGSKCPDCESAFDLFDLVCKWEDKIKKAEVAPLHDKMLSFQVLNIDAENMVLSTSVIIDDAINGEREEGMSKLSEHLRKMNAWLDARKTTLFE